jgi:hypothetical protein
MPETIEKLRPDRDLQCYFFQPTGVAALSQASADGFTVSGAWRQQFDWAVIEWNRDNVFEHPAFRALPDGDLSGLVLTYQETRTNCIPMDSDLFPTVDWPYLRIWAGDNGAEQTYYVKLRDYAAPAEGSYAPAYADFTLSGTAVAGDYIGLAYVDLHYTYQIQAGDTLESALQAIADGMNASWSPLLRATRTGTTLRAYYTAGASIENSTTGHNGNRFALYSYSTGSAVWDAAAKTFANGASPSKWEVTLDFSTIQGALRDTQGVLGTPGPIPADKIRKMRWTYAADLQAGAFERSEFAVVVSNWAVTGTGRAYKVAGPGSRRIEDMDPAMTFTGSWQKGRGNYSGGFIHWTHTPGDAFTCQYTAAQTHTLYLGTRYTNEGAAIAIEVDNQPAGTVNLRIPEEDRLIRWPVGQYGAGPHTITVTHTGPQDSDFYVDFIELAAPATDLPALPSMPNLTVATDFDTDHSLALAPERTAWMIHSLGFHGRHNYYVGALLFYELENPGNVYATGTVTFSGTADPNALVSITVGPAAGPATIERVIHAGDTPETIAISLAQELNRGYTSLWASCSGGVVTIQCRLPGEAGNSFTLEASTNSANLEVETSGPTLAGGVDGAWRTDLAATPRLNRAARDWSRSFFAALAGYGLEAAAAFSMELKHGDPSAEAGIAQRGPAGDPILLPTPALQTNFSPASTDFWKQAYLDCAALMDEAGLTPYLQFGEVQWWYFPHNGLGQNFSGMPFYDAWTTTEFQTRYNHAMAVFPDNDADPEQYPDEVEFLPALIGEFTGAVRSHVLAQFPNARFEVLYPYDVNRTAFNQAINYPVDAWTPAALHCLKTEGFGATFGKDLAGAEAGIEAAQALGFGPEQRSHLVGLGDATAPWLKEARIAAGKRFESVVLFALDQFCLIGYGLPLPGPARRSVRWK